MPNYEDPYSDLNERRRYGFYADALIYLIHHVCSLITLYQTVHDAIHAKSGQEGTLKLQYLRTEKESILGWVSSDFHHYFLLAPDICPSDH